MLNNYDPNFQRGTHVIEVVLQQWDYSRSFLYEVSGTVKGSSVLRDPEESLIDAWYAKAENGEAIEGVEVDLEDEIYFVSLINPDGKVLTVEICDESDLSDMIVSVRIVDVKERKE